MKLSFVKKTIYGRNLYFPACPLSKGLLTLLIKRNTFNQSMINSLEEAGFLLDIHYDEYAKLKNVLEMNELIIFLEPPKIGYQNLR